MSFGDVLRTLREERGISQKMLAIRVDITQSSISDWEADRKMPPVKTILKIADIFDVSLDRLFDRPIKKEIQPTADGDELDKELVTLLQELPPQDIQRVVDFVQGLKAAREAPSSQK